MFLRSFITRNRLSEILIIIRDGDFRNFCVTVNFFIIWIINERCFRWGIGLCLFRGATFMVFRKKHSLVICTVIV